MLEAISAREIAVSGLRAQRARMNVIANNLANVETTRTPEGGAFRRQMVVFRAEPLKSGMKSGQAGVRVKSIIKDMSPLRTVFDPSHPDANKDGYVSYPNINMSVEMVDLISAQRAYEANVAVIVSGSRMKQRALEILQR
ncbi:MAG TPA: flagellar basal body rod protein FlgC [Candidatus Hydrogenedentes bacterium]|nr:flagellar basal body rod protein FlgC [Candidatus Hydrogenedentota bacterium]